MRVLVHFESLFLKGHKMRVLKTLLVVCALLLMVRTATAQRPTDATLLYWVWGSGANVPYGQTAAGAWIWSNTNAPGISIQVKNTTKHPGTGWYITGTVWYSDINNNLLNGTNGTVFFNNYVGGSSSYTIPAGGSAQCNGGSDPSPPAGWYQGGITLNVYGADGSPLGDSPGLFIYYNNGNGSTLGSPNP
jgi:hypothetical protein